MEEVITPAFPGQGTILGVDDEANIRILIARSLQAQGYTVLEASNGSDALTLCTEYPKPIHLLITDHGMPLMNGAELIVRASTVRPAMKVLCLSGRDGAQYPPGGKRLPKPFALRALLLKVREALSERNGFKTGFS